MYWINGTQIVDGTPFYVMYYAHVEWDNEDGLDLIQANDYQEPV